GEPGTFKDRVLMKTAPGLMIEGMIAAGYAVGAQQGIIYLRAEYTWLKPKLDKTIQQFRNLGYLGEDIAGIKGFQFDVRIQLGAGAYVCGEETALLNSLEGKRGEPRTKWFYPTEKGFLDCPTVVNNVETAACVKHIIDRGADWFKSMGTPQDPDNPRDAGSYGPKLYCLSGHVERPGCYEAPLGITVQQLIDEYGGGIWKGRKAKAAIPGGISMGLLTADEFDCPLDFSGPGRYQCLGLGTAAVVVMDETVSMVDFLHNSARFFSHESCGQCTPCREGTSWALKLLNRIRAGRGRLIDLELLLEIGDNIGIIPGTTICGLSDGAAWPMKNAIRKFRGEFESYIRETNPTGYQETSPVPALAFDAH
ncbi:MAG: SLBB domain-containing protein, partial [Planctomycetales bacterium]|nr:SLBB domain-containing protein [Planctomycetales bacterium]